jgi:hypothetical protein
MGRVMYPFLFSASSRLTFAGRLTHSSMFFTGMWCSSAVRMLRGAVNFGVTCLSPFPAFGFLAFGVAFGRGLSSFRRGEIEGATGRPLRVVRLTYSSSIVDLGVGGEKSGCSFYNSQCMWRVVYMTLTYWQTIIVPVVVVLRCRTVSILLVSQDCLPTQRSHMSLHIEVQGQGRLLRSPPHVHHAKGCRHVPSISGSHTRTRALRCTVRSAADSPGTLLQYSVALAGVAG